MSAVRSSALRSCSSFMLRLRVGFTGSSAAHLQYRLNVCGVLLGAQILLLFHVAPALKL